jgi:protein-tyrosine phosphatase
MAERVARQQADETGLTGVRFTSAATSTEELGAPVDPRAARTLTAAGYTADGHHAHQITRDEATTADLVIAMEPVHVERIRRISGQSDNVRLLSDFDPQAEPGSGLADPWYGDEDGFADTLAAIEAAIPGVLEWVRRRQRQPSER